VSVRAPAALLVLCGLLAGCGDSDKNGSSTPAPTPANVAKNPEAEPGGAGDEAGNVQRVRMTVSRNRSIRPRRVEVTGFLAIDLTIRNRSGGGRLVSITGTGIRRGVEIGRGLTVTSHLDGLRPGTYRVQVEAGGRAKLVSVRSEP
jgi:hypothetical protein